MIFKTTLFLCMVFFYTVRESTTTEYTPSTEFDTQYVNTSTASEVDNAIVNYNPNQGVTNNNNKLPSNFTKSITTTDKITQENKSKNVKFNANGLNDSTLLKLESAEDKVYKVVLVYQKCESCPDEVAGEKKFWDNIRSRENAKISTPTKKLPNKANIQTKATKDDLKKSKTQPVTILEVKDHGDEIEIVTVNKADKNKINSNTTDARKYGIDNISVMNSENHPMVYLTNRADYTKRVDSQTLIQLQKFRKAKNNGLTLPGMSEMFRASASIRAPPKLHMRAEEHGAGTFGDVFEDDK